MEDISLLLTKHNTTKNSKITNVIITSFTQEGNGRSLPKCSTFAPYTSKCPHALNMHLKADDAHMFYICTSKQ